MAAWKAIYRVGGSMKRILIAIAVIFMSKAALSAPYKSMFGFEYELPKGWTVLKPDVGKVGYSKKLLQTLGSNNVYQNRGFGELLEKINAGEVEYLLSDRMMTWSNFRNNMRIQLVKNANPTNMPEKFSCSDIAKELKVLYFSQIRMKECGVKKSNGVSYLEYSFSRPLLGITAVQSYIPIGPGEKIVLMGASNKKAAKTLKKHQLYLAGVIIKHYKDLQNVSVSTKKVRKEKIHQEAVSGLEKLSSFGNADVQYNVGAILEKDQAKVKVKAKAKVKAKVKAKDPDNAIEHSQPAADMENPLELEKMADAYYKGKGVKKDIAKSIDLYIKAANLGASGAQNRYASILYQGLGVDKNQLEAKKWFLKAAKQGNEQAGRNLLAIYRAEARSGNQNSRYALAKLYISGDGVEKNSARGVSLLEKAASHGHEQSRIELEKIYSEGLYGIKKNPDMALKWSADK